MELRITNQGSTKLIQIMDGDNCVWQDDYAANFTDEEIREDMAGVLEKYEKGY